MSEHYVQDELQFTHFHFRATELYEDFCALTEAVIKNALQTLEELLVAKFPSKSELYKEEIKNLEEFYMVRSRGPLQKFKEAVKEIFALPVDGEDCSKKVTTEELQELRREVSELEEKYQQEVFYRGCLEKEIKKWEAVEPLYLEVNKVVGLMEKNKVNMGEKPLKELLDVVKSFEDFYYEKTVAQSKVEVVDDFNLFKMK